jgi:hypothetical protein
MSATKTIRVEEELGVERIVVSINKRGILAVYVVDRDHGKVRDQWTEGEFLRRAEKLAIVRTLVTKARELEEQAKEKEQEDLKVVNRDTKPEKAIQ